MLRHHSSECGSCDSNPSQLLLVPGGLLQFKGHSQYICVCSFCLPDSTRQTWTSHKLCHLWVLSDPAAAHQATGPVCSLHGGGGGSGGGAGVCICLCVCVQAERLCSISCPTPPAEGHSHLFSPSPLNTQTHGSRCRFWELALSGAVLSHLSTLAPSICSVNLISTPVSFYRGEARGPQGLGC